MELRDVEFKESQPFQTLRWKIVKSAMAMANLRDGGYIIIGVTQRDGRPYAAGIEKHDEVTYDSDIVIEAINKHARPPVNCRVRVVADSGVKRFVAIEVQSFDRNPVFCRRGSPDDVARGDRLTPGEIYVRSLDRIATTKVVDSDLMEELLEIAAERRAAEIVRRAQRAGFQVPNRERQLLRERLLEVTDEGIVDRVLDVIAEFARRPSASSIDQYVRERGDF